MNLFTKIPFPFDGKDYEVRIHYQEGLINVVAFLDNHPANGFRYQVQVPKGCDPKSVLDLHPAPELVEKCQEDLQQKRWEALSKIIKK